MPEGYLSRWGTLINPTIKQLEELAMASQKALEFLRADQHFCTANRLEDAVAVVTGDSTPLSKPVVDPQEARDLTEAAATAGLQIKPI